MSLRKTIMLAIVLVIVAVFTFRSELPRIEFEKIKDMPFSTAGKQGIKSVKIDRQGTSFELINLAPSLKKVEEDEGTEKNGPEVKVEAGKWKIAGLDSAEVDAAAINTLLSSLSGLKTGAPLAKDEVGTDLGVYGLSAPEASVKVESLKEGGVDSLELSFGKKNSYLNKRYLKVSKMGDETGAGLYLVTEGLFSAVSKGQSDYRKRNPIEIQDSDLRRISLERDGKKIVVERVLDIDEAAGESVWKIVEPSNLRGNEKEVGELVKNLRNLKAKDFFDGEQGKPESFGLTDKSSSIKLEYKEALKRDPLVIKVAVTKAGVDKETAAYFQISSEPTVFSLAADPSEGLFKPIEAWREKRFISFPMASVSEVDVSGDGVNAIKLVKKDTDWLVNDKPADDSFVREYLNNISQLEASSYPKETIDYGFGKPSLKISVTLTKTGKSSAASSEGGGKPEEAQGKHLELVIGKIVEKDSNGEAKNYYAAVGDLSEPFIISKEQYKKIVPKEDVLIRLEKPQK